jgi:hypothetical protein
MTSARFGALWLVAATLIAGLAVIAFSSVRWGGLIVAGALFAGALIRLILPGRRAGGLVVRSRLAVTLFVIVIALDLRPRG